VTDSLHPRTAEDVRAIVSDAAAAGTPLEVRGAGTKRTLGRPVQARAELALDGLAGIVDYEPEELVLSAGAGTPLALIEAALAPKRQCLAFEPADYGALLGREPGGQTLGGVIACNLSGPRRLKAGAARDHFLGFTAVSGRGETFKAGGHVVKNVTGYDLSKLLAGSWGTLAVMTEVTVKVLPAPEKTRTVLVYGLDEAAATKLFAAALATPHEVSGAAHLPARIAARSDVPYVRDAGAAVTAVRVEGPGPSVEHRCTALRLLLGAQGPVEELHSMNSRRLWAEIRDAALIAKPAERPVWRLSVPPASGASVGTRLCALLGAEACYDWAGGLVWLAVPPAADAGAGAIRAATAEAGGHATLIRAPYDVRAAVDVFEPQNAALAALQRRLKEQFDPAGILNPGRMYAGA
jgi:glycolate oxidase FAD binding subunit